VTITNHQRHVFNAQATDTAVAEGLEAAGLQVRQFATLLLREPGDVRVDMGRWCGHFGTLTPFDRRALLPLLFGAFVNGHHGSCETCAWTWGAVAVTPARRHSLTGAPFIEAVEPQGSFRRRQ